jgi:hypothetical protein
VSTARPPAFVRAILLLALMAGLLACKGTPSTPEDTLRQFLSDLRSRRAKEAWVALSKESQAAIKEDATQIAGAVGNKPEEDPAKLLYERAEIVLLSEPESISVASRPGDSVLLRVAVAGGKSATIRMVKEGPGWKVDLVRSVQAFEQRFEPPDEPEPDEARTSTTP